MIKKNKQTFFQIRLASLIWRSIFTLLLRLYPINSTVFHSLQRQLASFSSLNTLFFAAILAPTSTHSHHNKHTSVYPCWLTGTHAGGFLFVSFATIPLVLDAYIHTPPTRSGIPQWDTTIGVKLCAVCPTFPLNQVHKHTELTADFMHWLSAKWSYLLAVPEH